MAFFKTRILLGEKTCYNSPKVKTNKLSLSQKTNSSKFIWLFERLLESYKWEVQACETLQLNTNVFCAKAGHELSLYEQFTSSTDAAWIAFLLVNGKLHCVVQ